MKINELIKLGQSSFQNISSTPLLDIQLILCHFLSRSKSYLITHGNEEIDIKTNKLILKAIEKRKNHYPIAYITNIKEFFGRDFYVDERVLIPRPETEDIVLYTLHIITNYQILKFNNEDKIKKIIIDYKNRYWKVSPTKERIIENYELFTDKKFFTNIDIDSNILKILDIGTGSGIISCSIKFEWDLFVKNLNLLFQKTKPIEIKIYASDISSDALNVAKNNASTFGVDITFIKSDLLNSKKFPDHFDIIVANLPYVKSDFYNKDIDHEPKISLYSGIDGLDHYRELSHQITNKRCSNLLIECDDQQTDHLSEIFPKAKKIKIMRDLAGRRRIGHIIYG